MTRAPIPYSPFPDGPYRLTMGLQSLDPAEWLWLDRDYDDDLAEKQRLIASRHDEVFAAQPATEAMGAEVLALVVDFLATHPSGRFVLEADETILWDRQRDFRHNLIDPRVHPLDRAGRLVQEDLCLMVFDPAAGSHQLTAASLCFPSRWRLADKLGRPVGPIHQPVPDFDQRLTRPVDRLFAALAEDRLVWRSNWSLFDDPALFQPVRRPLGSHDGNDRPVAVAEVGERLWLRSERQTLRRLPRTNGVLFTIRTFVQPVAEVIADPQWRADLIRVLSDLPEPMARYKGVQEYRERILAFLVL